jgi:hypothetical protein
MKLFYDRKSKDPIYYIQQGIRNGKKTTTKNVKRIGKHSELLAHHFWTLLPMRMNRLPHSIKNSKREKSI